MAFRTLGRITATAVLVAGLGVVTAPPAAATTATFVVQSGSTVTLHDSTSQTNSDLITLAGHPTTNTCAPNSTTGSLSPDLDSTGGITLEAADYGFAPSDYTFPGSTSNFEVRVVGVGTPTTGVITSTLVALTISFVIEISSCGSTPVVCRTNPITATLSGANPSGSVHPGVSTTLTLTGSTTTHLTTFIGCNTLLRLLLTSHTAWFSLILHRTA